MEPAAGSERRSPSGPAVPPSPRGHAPLAAAPGPLGSPAREPPQPEEGQQLRISQSGQFSDGLEDRGERAPPGAFPGRVGAVRSRLYPLRVGRARDARGRGAGTSQRRRGDPRAASAASAATPSSEAESRLPPEEARRGPRLPLWRPLEKFAGGGFLPLRTSAPRGL